VELDVTVSVRIMDSITISIKQSVEGSLYQHLHYIALGVL